MKRRGSLFVEETLLLLLAIGVFVAFALTVTGMIKGAIGGILGFRNETNSLLDQLVNSVKQLVLGS